MCIRVYKKYLRYGVYYHTFNIQERSTWKLNPSKLPSRGTQSQRADFVFSFINLLLYCTPLILIMSVAERESCVLRMGPAFPS